MCVTLLLCSLVGRFLPLLCIKSHGAMEFFGIRTYLSNKNKTPKNHFHLYLYHPAACLGCFIYIKRLHFIFRLCHLSYKWFHYVTLRYVVLHCNALNEIRLFCGENENVAGTHEKKRKGIFGVCISAYIRNVILEKWRWGTARMKLNWMTLTLAWTTTELKHLSIVAMLWQTNKQRILCGP